MKQLTTIVVSAALAGCMADGMDADDGLCGASQLDHLVGQNAHVLTDFGLPENRRVVRPGMAITMDYQPDRLNIGIDEDEVIDRIWCG